MQSLFSRFRGVTLAAATLLCACEQTPSPITQPNLPGPRYGGHGGGGTISAVLQFNGLLVNGGSCIGDDAVTSGLLNGLKSTDDIKCTSTDISLTSMIVTEYSYDGITFSVLSPGQAIPCQRGTTIFLRAAGALTQNANSGRTDVGIWVSYDGGDAITGSCQQYSLVPGAVEGVSNLDSDLCGDMTAGSSTLIPFDLLALQCEDRGTGLLNISTCIGWKNAGADAICPWNGSFTDEAYRFGTLPAQKSKCNCSSVQLPVTVTG